MEEAIILATTVVAGMTSYLASNILKRGSVIGSAIVTLVSGLMLLIFS